MSFFDEGDEPRTRTARTRATRASRPRSPRPRSGGRPPGGPRGTSSEQLLLRRALLLGAAVVVLILIVVGVKSCRDSAHRDSLRTYDSTVAGLLSDSQAKVSRPLFALLQGASSRSPINVETAINGQRTEAQQEANRARDLSVPDELVNAQRDLVLALDLRTGALTQIAGQIRGALGSTAAGAARAEIAGQMQAFLASDVIVSQRVVPLVAQVLRDQGLRASTTAVRFLPNLGWLNPQVLGGRLDGQAGGGHQGPIAPGRHGHQLSSVSVGGTTLSAGANNTVTSTGKPTFDVSFLNQGTNDETNVVVKVNVTGPGTSITGQQTVPKTLAGQSATARVALPQAPPAGKSVTVTVTVEPVPGEKTVSNNTQTYTVTFG